MTQHPAVISTERRTGMVLTISGSVLLLLLLLWVAFMVLLPPAKNLNAQLAQLARSSTLYQITFLNASLISIPLTLILIQLLMLRETLFNLTGAAGCLFLAPYVLLVSIAYTSQYTLFPGLLESMYPGDVAAVRQWFFYDENSIAFFLDLLGYTFFGIAALFIGRAVMIGEGALFTSLGWLLWGSAATAILGFAVNIPLLQFGVGISGGLMLPFSILVIIFGLRRICAEQEQ